jgi:hypothetical protein
MDLRVGGGKGSPRGQEVTQVHRKLRVVVLSAHAGTAPRQQAGTRSHGDDQRLAGCPTSHATDVDRFSSEVSSLAIGPESR